MIIQVLLPDGRVVGLQVADNDLVYDGRKFVEPATARYVELYGVPVDALSLPFNLEQLSHHLMTEVRMLARVVGNDDTPGATSDPLIVVVPDPSDGICVCFVTCSGTELRFIQVQVEEQ